MSRSEFERVGRKSTSARAKGRIALTREDVVAAGARLLDSEGIDGVSMRRLAEILDTGPATLYWHVRDKRELLLAVLEETLRDVRAPSTGPWHARLLELLRRGRRALRARPALIDVLWRSGWQLGPEALRVVDEALGLIAESGLPKREVPDAYYTITTFLFGFVVAEATSPGTGGFAASKEQARTLPHLARHRPAADLASMDRRFEAGIARLVASLAPARPRRRRTRG